MRKTFLSITAVILLFTSCSNDTNEVNIIEEPATYSFQRNGATTVSFSGQTTRIQMGNDLVASLLDPTETASSLKAKYAHNEGENNFDNASLNASSKNIKTKVAASADYFSANTTTALTIRNEFEGWIDTQVNDVFPFWSANASRGNAGQLQEAGGGAIRYVDAKGLELNQLIMKGLIGALMLDQMLNNYLSPAVLDAGSNRTNNDANILVDGKNYTTMEHYWDEAFGYLYGNESDAANPTYFVDEFLNKYVGRLNNDVDFEDMPEEIYDAFKLGRAAIVAKDYETRDAQAEIIKEKISEIMGIRAVYYLQQAKLFLPNDKGTAFHDLSEGIGFIYSLQFTRMPYSNNPYFTRAEVQTFIDTLLAGDGFWDITNTTLDEMSVEIASRFNFTINQAKS